MVSTLLTMSGVAIGSKFVQSFIKDEIVKDYIDKVTIAFLGALAIGTALKLIIAISKL